MKSPLLNFAKFKVDSQATELIQLYVSRESHTWVKNTANTNKVKMAYVIAELIDYAERDKEVFKHILRTLRELTLATASMSIDPELRMRVNTLIHALDESL